MAKVSLVEALEIIIEDFENEYEDYLEWLKDFDLPDIIDDCIDCEDSNAYAKGLVFIEAFYNVIYDLGYLPDLITLFFSVSDISMEFINNNKELQDEYYKVIYNRFNI